MAKTGDHSGKRKRLSNSHKLSVIKAVEIDKQTHAQAATKFGISRTAVTTILKEKEAIRAAVASAPTMLTKKNSKMVTKCALIDDMLHRWHVSIEIDAPTLNITGQVLQAKALDFRDRVLKDFSGNLDMATKKQLESFKASNGWLENYKVRTGTRSVRKCGEHSSIDQSAINSRLAEIRTLLVDVPLDSIWNLDVAGLQHRTTSSRSFVTVNHDGRGVKRSKERITITPIVSAACEKMDIQLIGKSKSPRALKNVDIHATFGIDYMHQSKAWQDGSSSMKLLHRINRHAKSRKKVYRILLDNASVHLFAAKMLDPDGSSETCFKFESIIIIFFPPNATSECQPLDQGIIRSIKASYRKSVHAEGLVDRIRAVDGVTGRWRLQQVSAARSYAPAKRHEVDPRCLLRSVTADYRALLG